MVHIVNSSEILNLKIFPSKGPLWIIVDWLAGFMCKNNSKWYT